MSLTVDAIVFLAPISAFDQVLAEDRTVNRLVRFSLSSLVPTLIGSFDVVCDIACPHVTGRLCAPLEGPLFQQITRQRRPCATPE
jgi:hypothetical protein